MNKKRKPDGMNRRQFLQTSAASAMFFSLGSGLSFAASEENSIPWVKLNNGVRMPRLGLGTMTLNGDPGVQCVADAISLGYRLIDTAMIYDTEKQVGEGVKQSGIKREELFITSKLWKTDMGYEKAKEGFQASLNKLGMDYLDLYLIHRPSGGDWKGSWKAMEELYHDGKIRAIGMSNADFDQMDFLMANSEVKPAVHQIETHAFYQEGQWRDYSKQHDIQMEAWSPLAEGRHGLFTNDTLAAIGAKHNKTVAQVCVRWHYQRGVVAIPRSHQKAHIAENIDIFDFKLSKSEMATIASLDLNKTQFPEWT